MLSYGSRDIVLYATDTMADWEYGYLTSGITWADDADPGRCRLRIRTEGAIGDVDPSEVALLVLPGADTWDEGHDQALALATSLVQAGTPVAAICGATLGLARAGLLDDRAHTSNAPEFLTASGYAGSARYREERAVDDRGVITAGAAAPVDFAAAVFRRLELFPPAVVDAWYGLYTTGERKYFELL